MSVFGFQRDLALDRACEDFDKIEAWAECVPNPHLLGAVVNANRGDMQAMRAAIEALYGNLRAFIEANYAAEIDLDAERAAYGSQPTESDYV